MFLLGYPKVILVTIYRHSGENGSKKNKDVLIYNIIHTRVDIHT